MSTVDALGRFARVPMVDRFWAQITPEPMSGCWLWTGTRCGPGYGTIWHAGKTVRAHRVAYELLVGPIPAGLQLDHLCRNRMCVNPKHLEPVTSRENTLRGSSPAARRAVQTHCIHGHEFNSENTYIDPLGYRRCRVCPRERRRRAA